MATEPKPLALRMPRQSNAVRRLAQLAAEPALRDASLWLIRERNWINQIHLELCRIPAPTFFEKERAAWFNKQLQGLGWNARLDRAGNVLASFGRESTEPGALPSLVVSAHLDTVFAPGRPSEIAVSAGGRLTGPGVSDNGSGLSALLAIARLLSEKPALHELASQVLLVANVGEEGEGNLSGMRYLCQQTLAGHRLAAFIVLDGPASDHITARALASRRFEVLLSGPGGHSWNDYGRPNAVHAISGVVSTFAESAEARIAAEGDARCAFNFGIVEGGTSINAIPSSARVKLDLRSENAGILDEFATLLSTAVERSLERENRKTSDGRLGAKIRELGSRPGGSLPTDSTLLASIQAVDSFLNIRSRLDCASTDANVPLSMGLPAISIGAGGQGGGAHTSGEWYQPEGREVGLHRILLLLADIQRNSSLLSSTPNLDAASQE